MAGWRGNLAKLVPEYGWRKIMGLSVRPTAADCSVEALRANQIEEFSGQAWGLDLRLEDAYGVIYRSPAESTALRARLAEAGVRVFALDRAALSANIVRGWACSPQKVSGTRRDLAEAIGFRILETADGLVPSHRNAMDFDSPVDLVYTWVDGNDGQWLRAKMKAAEKSDEEELPTATDDARFTSNDELKFSLRSVEAFLPWVNHIYIVTAGHKPEWLNDEHPRISIVRHEDIFTNGSNLPTFNSHAIESQLHHIPGLAEHFVYVNDDVLFGRSLRPEVFFTASGMARFQLSERDHESDLANGLPVNVAARNNAEILRRRFGVNSTLKFKHVAHPQRKSVLEQLELENPEQFARTAAANFRSSDDLSIPSSLAHYYGLALGKAVSGSASYKYIDVGSHYAQMELAKLLWSDRPQMLCLNQVSSVNTDLSDQSRMMQEFLERAFPWPSSMERNDSE